MSKKPVALIIMDGFGHNPDTYGNAIAAAKKPNLDKYWAEYPHNYIGASGLDVGLPDGQMGNSEVGHTNIGAGRIVYQMLVKISKDIKDGTFFENKAIKASMEACKAKGSALHLMGLLSPGGVHSHMEHMYGIVEMAKKMGLEKVYIHAFLDGRDVPPSSAAEYMEEAVKELEKIGLGKIATISGRFYAMDRDNAWDRVEKAYSAMVYGEGVQEKCPVQAIRNSYDNGVTDEFMLPTVIEGGAQIKADDSVIFFNFRPDRARQITRSFVDPDFSGFERKNGFFPLNFVCMAQYDATMPNVTVAYPPEQLTMTMGEYLAKLGKTQLRIAETQKYAHVTFFFNGGEEKTFEGEDRILIKSPDVETFDMKPEMSAYEVCDAVVEAINSDKYDVIILNYANCDMVGHTGVFDAAVQAVEAVDECVGRMVDAILAKG
ncbi:MAG: 2,3-bisphosphoglycerate-independent phosphoglycerate mutase, partial [Ruminococcus sp.]|nr:2,3-bisphosphoglycerate-independent phosphoglycerate mutase [Ruminococcus sp.]